MSIVALIVAGGRGSRFGSSTPKTYASLAGRPTLTHSISTFARHPAIDAVRVVINPENRALYDQAATYCGGWTSLLEPVPGGRERQDSVRLGLESISSLSPKHVVIHDAARPLVTGDLIDRVLTPLTQDDTVYTGSIAALPVTDTIKRGSGPDSSGPQESVQGTLDRSTLWRAQTPQAFDFQAIMAAHQAVKDRLFTDDSAVAEEAGLRVALVPGEEENFKITVGSDLHRAEALLTAANADIRVGSGIDTHRFGPGEQVMLCGVAIPHDKGLQGHSDADVALHAITDALLSTVGAGDIGMHFPPTDETWRDTSSDVFAAFASRKVQEHDGFIAHVDVTIVCERPRIAPYRIAMQESVATILRIEPARVSVKGTTTEQLGFTGRGEGISAFTSATVRLPLRTSDYPSGD